MIDVEQDVVGRLTAKFDGAAPAALFRRRHWRFFEVDLCEGVERSVAHRGQDGHAFFEDLEVVDELEARDGVRGNEEGPRIVERR